MAFTYGFYNSVKGDRKYDAIQISSIFDGIISDGVYATIKNGFLVEQCQPASMAVKVKSGRAWFNHTWSLNDSDYVVQVQPSEVVLTRIDAVVIEVNSYPNVRANSIKVIKGVPSGTPTPPTMAHTEYINQYPLAYITVAPEVTEITGGVIESRRGTPECPFVTCLLETIDIEDLVYQWKCQFQEWMLKNEREFTTWSTYERDWFDRWFRTIQIELDENVAALLLEKCRYLKTVRYVNLPKSGWSKPGAEDKWTQYVEVDEHGASLLYLEDDNPVMVSAYNDMSALDKASVKKYNKIYGIVASGVHVIETARGGITFTVFKEPFMDVRIGLKGV